MRLFSSILIVALFVFSQQLAAQKENGDLAATAGLIAQKALIVDTHIDVPYRLREGWADVTVATADGDFDYERAKRGGLDVLFMSIFTPADLEAKGGSFQLANELIDSSEALVGRAPHKFMMVHNTADAEKARQEGLIGLALGMENGAPIAGKLENVQFFYDRGIRYITLAHGLSNHISDSSYDTNRPWKGLSPFGREVVAEMNRVGIMVDISHVSDEAFYQVMQITKVPVIASHSSARFFTPGFERNMSDDMIRALGANGGVIQINFGSSFLTRTAWEWFDIMRKAQKAWLAETGNAAHSVAANEWEKTYRVEHPFPYASISDLADHFDHVVELVGVDHLGIGSDFDGVGDSLPTGIKDVAFYPALIEELLRREYTPQQIEAILGGNLMRVWRAVEQAAAKS
jgi:membrane dipeptidase